MLNNISEFQNFFEQLTICCLEDQDKLRAVIASGVILPAEMKAHFDALRELGIKSANEDLAALPKTTRLLLLKKQNEFILPKSPSIIAQRANEIIRRHKIFEAAEQIFKKQTDPDVVIDLINFKKIEPVESGALEDLSSYYIQETKEIASKGDTRLIVPGFEHLSKGIGGFNPQRISIFTGETGLGKTNFAVNFCLAAAKVGAVAYVNMEMSFRDMVSRFAVIGGSDYKSYFSGRFIPLQVENSIARPFEINITSGRQLSLGQIKAHLTLLKSTKNIKFAVIDYDQKIELKYEKNIPEWKELQNILIELEDTAKELELHIMVLAQVNREGAISGSFRSLFPAHTVLAFTIHADHGPIIHAKKNRHGKKNLAVKVDYSESSSRITEKESIIFDPEVKEIKPFKQRPQNV